MSIVIICFPGRDVINFGITIIFLIKPLHGQKLKKKKSIVRKKELLRSNRKHFSSFLKGFQLPKVVLDLGVHL